MQYELSIRDHNQRFHLAVDKEMYKKKDGLMTFVLRVDGGNIVDLVLMETKSYGKQNH